MTEVIRYDLIHAIEKNYGSISNCSDDDPCLKELQDYYEKFRDRSFIPSQKEEIINYLKHGYSTTEIKNIELIPGKYVDHIANDYHIKVRSHFAFLIKDATDTYVATQEDLYSIIHVSKYLRDIRQYKLRHPGKLIDIDIKWEHLPNGARYIVNGKTYVKHGLDSYLKD